LDFNKKAKEKEMSDKTELSSIELTKSLMQAIYANIALVSFSKEDVVINFGISAPLLISDDNSNDNTPEKVLPISRVFLSLSTAKELFEQLKEALGDSESPKLPEKEES
jgi:hypothetical protein